MDPVAVPLRILGEPTAKAGRTRGLRYSLRLRRRFGGSFRLRTACTRSVTTETCSPGTGSPGDSSSRQGRQRNALTTVDVTADGKRVWFVGSSGSLGVYDLRTGEKYDYSAPKQKTSTWEAIAVTGQAGNETLRTANGSGEVLSVTTDDNGCPQWGEVTKPGGGSSIAALDYSGEACYVVDTSGNVFRETDDGWERIGIKNVPVNFFDVAATEDTVLVAGSDGRVYRYDRPCGNWTPVDAGTGALQGIAHTKEVTIAVGASGHIFKRRPDDGWTRISSPVENDLFSVALGKRSVAVGADGTIVQRSPQ